MAATDDVPPAVSPHDRVRVRVPALCAALLVCFAAPVFFVLEWLWLGWVLLGLGLALAAVVSVRRPGVGWGEALPRVVAHGAASVPDVASVPGSVVAPRPPSLLRDLSLIAIGLAIVRAIPLAAQLDNWSMVKFTLALGGAVAVPYVISRWVYRERATSFPWRGGGKWGWWHWGWLLGVLVLGVLLLPFYFISSGVYLNWPVVDSPSLIARLFVGVGAVGIWDELFFICTVFALLRRHFPIWIANIMQAIVFVSFLWELGYRSWGPLLTIPFALVQAMIFARTKSLAYVVTVHLLFDAVVFGVLVYAHATGG